VLQVVLQFKIHYIIKLYLFWYFCCRSNATKNR